MPYLRAPRAPAHTTRAHTTRSRSTPALIERFLALRTTHARLDAELAAERKRPLPDTAVTQHLKRRKLLVKDEIASIERLLTAIGASMEDAAEQGAPAVRLSRLGAGANAPAVANPAA